MAPFTNRLARESSPYLLQHAHNPVDWYPWGEEALDRARDTGLPIFLSIGYSACHWCHVMAHESFEDPVTAELMNRLFVNIKVDREERPDLDHIYQTAYQLLAGRGGGWPLSMFLTPDLGPFWGGTYFPNMSRHGMPAFREVLAGVAHHYRENPEDVTHNVTALVQGLVSLDNVRPGELSLTDPLLEAACQGLIRNFDATWGGFGGAPKFPATMALSLLLARGYRHGDDKALHVVTHSLEQMARGGIHDHLGGGFARYAVDEKWLTPHFEKMLYDNALLATLYLDAHAATGNPQFARVARGILDYVSREMTHPEGGFYAAQDADSEGEEGKYFVWRPGEIEEVIGAEAAPLFMTYYQVTDSGNFEGQNILWTSETLAEVAADLGMDTATAEASLAASRAKLLARRGERVAPGRDDKIICAWNGLMVSAFARAGQVLGDGVYLRIAERAADFLCSRLVVNGRLMRTFSGGAARHPACLDDYVFLAQGFLDLHQATGDPARLAMAQELMATVTERFAAPGGGFHFTADDHEDLISRPRTGMDQSLPSGNSVAARCLIRLHHLTGDGACLKAAEGAVRAFLTPAVSQPLGYANLLLALDALVHPPATVALAAPDGDDAAARWRAEIGRRYLPNVILTAPAADQPPQGTGPTAYVCRAGTCLPPVTDLAALWPCLDPPESAP